MATKGKDDVSTCGQHGEAGCAVAVERTDSVQVRRRRQDYRGRLNPRKSGGALAVEVATPVRSRPQESQERQAGGRVAAERKEAVPDPRGLYDFLERQNHREAGGAVAAGRKVPGSLLARE